jgi:hypothetical protein
VAALSESALAWLVPAVLAVAAPPTFTEAVVVVVAFMATAPMLLAPAVEVVELVF